MLILHPETFLDLFISSNSLGNIFGSLSMEDHVTFNIYLIFFSKNQLIVSLLFGVFFSLCVCISFIYSPFLPYDSGKFFHHALNKHGESGHPCPVPDFIE